MPLRLLLTPQAEEDLFEIWLFIAADNPAAADQLIADVEKGWSHLAEFPLSGEARTDLAPGIRRQVTRRHQTLYKIEDDAILIMRVLAPKGKPVDKEASEV
ncbi:MAG: type II toxin-antitoxin system RelE/ParE family toxin [Rhizobiales bacterium]|nr:type II toxin-antitoxin system RelE/ParE family toxin [Hyphomicrobiales bacterium]MBO6697853.1 type II toxin-antitoxin system RelE/ParE family toxin [Hyphomicrobiales bacterium]MBO6735892.1 type II toxin-antitoxin system RelE/ParE family toxin [Hyphomicrobiales bacterium]MBO6913904.1 type II toxin-antitoxin system RelE/ParE family toxin [Hyphomicrobiales bacterium]MBO6955607.1 type II toxin-antitoxin system RelE/ParE family toxin [Hyphomicrobiales bacterium]